MILILTEKSVYNSLEIATLYFQLPFTAGKYFSLLHQLLPAVSPYSDLFYFAVRFHNR